MIASQAALEPKSILSLDPFGMDYSDFSNWKKREFIAIEIGFWVTAIFIYLHKLLTDIYMNEMNIFLD